MDISGNSGVVVTCKCVKNRQVKPKQVKIEISFENGMNPFKGLLEFCRPEFFDQIGIGRGKMEVDKKTGEMTFISGNGKWYVSHLNKSFYEGQVYNSEVFTDEILHKIEPVVNNYFKYKSLEEQEQIEKELESLMGEDDEFKDFDSSDAEDIFQ